MDFLNYFIGLKEIFQANESLYNVRFGDKERKKAKKLYRAGLRDSRQAYFAIVIKENVYDIKKDNKTKINPYLPKHPQSIKVAKSKGLNTEKMVEETQIGFDINRYFNNSDYVRTMDSWKLDRHSSLVVAKYLQTEQDYINFTKVSKSKEEVIPSFRYNPINKSRLFVNRETKVYHTLEYFLDCIFQDDEIGIEFNKPIFCYKFDFEFPIELLELVPNGRLNFNKGILITRESNPYLKTTGTVILPDEIIRLPDKCFLGCLASEIKFPKGLKSLGEECFSFSGSLTEVEIPEGVTHIGDRCFSNCESLSRVVIPSTLKEISIRCFSDSGVQDVVLSEGVEVLGMGCFASCRLRRIVLPETLIRIEKGAFADCPMDYIILPTSLVLCDSAFFSSFQVTMHIIAFKGTTVTNYGFDNKQSYSILTYETKEELERNLLYLKRYYRGMFLNQLV